MASQKLTNKRGVGCIFLIWLSQAKTAGVEAYRLIDWWNLAVISGVDQPGGAGGLQPARPGTGFKNKTEIYCFNLLSLISELRFPCCFIFPQRKQKKNCLQYACFGQTVVKYIRSKIDISFVNKSSLRT